MRKSKIVNRESKRPVGAAAVRISAGRWKGKALEVPPSARPTSSKAREALFDILRPVLAGARVLDLHAGSGAVGFEALSRGAERATLVDVEPDAARRNAEKLGAGEAVEVLACDADEAVRRLAARGVRFDLVFSDPPYDGDPLGDADLGTVLEPGGVLVLQADSATIVESPRGLARTDERIYGRNVFHFFARERRGEPKPR